MRSHVRIVSGALGNATSHGSPPPWLFAVCVSQMRRCGRAAVWHVTHLSQPLRTLSRVACSLFLTGPKERGTDAVAGLNVLPRGDMVVDVHRDAGLGVAQALADHLGVGAHLEEQGGIGVALVVDADAGHAGLLDPAVIVARQVAGLDRRADRRGEPQIVVWPGAE